MTTEMGGQGWWPMLSPPGSPRAVGSKTGPSWVGQQEGVPSTPDPWTPGTRPGTHSPGREGWVPTGVSHSSPERRSRVRLGGPVPAQCLPLGPVPSPRGAHDATATASAPSPGGVWLFSREKVTGPCRAGWPPKAAVGIPEHSLADTGADKLTAFMPQRVPSAAGV